MSVRNTQTTLGALKLKGPSGDSKQPNEVGESDNSRQKLYSEWMPMGHFISEND